MSDQKNPCQTCRGDGVLIVGEGRGERRVCPMCRGKGIRS